MGLRFSGPPQGWAALRWEVGVVFIGIALALAAQQLADLFYWRGQAVQARHNIEEELLRHERDHYERLAVQGCLKGQLQALVRALSAGDGAWKAMPMVVNPIGYTERVQAAQRVVPAAYRAPERLWLDDSWQTAQASGALNYLPDALVASYAEIYTRGRNARNLQDAEAEGASRITALALDGRFDSTTRANLLAAIGKIDHDNSYIENGARQALDELRTALRTVSTKRRSDGIAERINGQLEFRGSCVTPMSLKA